MPFFSSFNFLYESVTINSLHQHLQIGGWKDCANFCLGNPSSCKAWTYRDEPIRCQFLAFLQVFHTCFFTILLSWGFHDYHLYDNFWSSYDDNQHHLNSCNSSKRFEFSGVVSSMIVHNDSAPPHTRPGDEKFSSFFSKCN